MRTYWQAEILHGHGSLNIEFPRRETAREAKADAQEARLDLAGRDLATASGWVSEWRDNDGVACNTGECKQVW